MGLWFEFAFTDCGGNVSGAGEDTPCGHFGFIHAPLSLVSRGTAVRFPGEDFDGREAATWHVHGSSEASWRGSGILLILEPQSQKVGAGYSLFNKTRGVGLLAFVVQFSGDDPLSCDDLDL